MNPDTRMALSLVLSLIVSARNLQLAAAGHADIVVVGIRYVLAFVVAFVVVGAIGRVFNDYLAGAAVRAGSDREAPDPGVDSMRLADDQ